MTRDPRHIALDILCRVEAGAYADRLLNAHRHGLNPADRDLLQHLVRGVLTHRGRIDAVLAPYLKKPLTRQAPGLRNLLRLGVYQLQYLDRVPAYAVVSESVTLADLQLGKPVSRLVNAVLRGVSENRKPARFPNPNTHPVQHLATSLSHPEWLVRRWLNRYGIDATRRLCERNNTRPVLTVRPNPLRTTPDALIEQLSESGIHARPAEAHPNLLEIAEVGDLFQSPAFRNGLFSVQGPGAARVVDLLAPQPGESLLDLCSAPGGKTTNAAEQMVDRGHIVAMDLRPARLKTVRENARRLELHSIHTLAADARQLPLCSSFDRVLIDAPCSALGILNHHPEARWRRTESDIAALAHRQQALLFSGAQCVRPGGILVYSTCTLEPEENEAVVEAFLADHPHFRLEPAAEYLPIARGAYLQIQPHEHGCDGAFATRLRRV